MSAEKRTTLAEFAEDLGVSKQRIHKLKQEERIPGWRTEADGTITLPGEPWVKRGKRTRPGTITTYIQSYERAYGLDPRDNVVDGV